MTSYKKRKERAYLAQNLSSEPSTRETNDLHVQIIVLSHPIEGITGADCYLYTLLPTVLPRYHYNMLIEGCQAPFVTTWILLREPIPYVPLVFAKISGRFVSKVFSALVYRETSIRNIEPSREYVNQRAKIQPEESRNILVLSV